VEDEARRDVLHSSIEVLGSCFLRKRSLREPQRMRNRECAKTPARDENLVPGLFLEIGDSFIVPSESLLHKPCTPEELAAALAGAVAMPRLP